MSELFTSGSVGRAPGNRCSYPESQRIGKKTGKASDEELALIIEGLNEIIGG
jgi:hypothetical protein